MNHLEIPPPLPDFDKRYICWDCKSRPRVIVFLPDDMGSYLSVKCGECGKATEVIERLFAKDANPDFAEVIR